MPAAGTLPGTPICAANVFVAPLETAVPGLTGNGNVQISSNSTIKAVDVQAGTSAPEADGNVSLISRNGGDIQVESVKAIGDQITVQTSAWVATSSIVLPPREMPTSRLNLLTLNLQGTGNFGVAPVKPSLNGIIDVSVENIEGTVTDGGLYLHALGRHGRKRGGPVGQP